MRINVEKYGRVRRDTDENMIMRIGFSSCITRATETHSECSNIIPYYSNNGYTNAPRCYVIGTLPLALNFNSQDKYCNNNRQFKS